MAATVRGATSEDAELLHDLARRTFALACPPGTTPDAVAAFIAEHLSVESFWGYLGAPSRTILIGELDDQPAGYVMFDSTAPSDPDVVSAITMRPAIELSKCYVVNDFHGTGVAAALVNTGIELARSLDFAAVWLGVNKENVRANRFYEKMGFRLVGSKKFLVGQRWEDDYVRELLLDERVKNS